MAKSKSKSGMSAAEKATASVDKATKTVTADVDDMPKFDASTLDNLTAKITQQLQQPKSPKQSNQKAKGKQDKKSVPKNETKPAPKAAPQPTAKPAKKEQLPNQGKKRTRDGDVKTQPAVESKPVKKGKTDEALRAEILTLGGTEDDYKLLAGIDSEDEDEVLETKGRGKDADGKLKADIAKMMAEMGSTPAPEQDADTEEEEELSDEDLGEDSDDMDVDEDEEDEPMVHKSAAANLNSKFLVQPRPDWFATPLSEIKVTSGEVPGLPQFLLDRVSNYATELLEAENQTFSTDSGTSSSSKFYATIMTSGTLSDKISALTLAVQESPLHNLKALESLVGLSKKRSRAQAVEVLRALKDLFAHGSILPGDRKLRYLSNQPALAVAFGKIGFQWREREALPKGLTKQHLIMWAFEERLKNFYFDILKVLEVWCNDEIEFARARAVSYVYELLKEKPEQEANLLRLLVNKLGDPNKKIASRASYLLLQLEEVHPMMKATVIAAIESEFLFKPGQNQHAKYYAIITLNQTSISTKDESVALKLLDIYFGLFVSLLKPKDSKTNGKFNKKDKKDEKKGDQEALNLQEEELREKVVSAVLTGVNRAYPYITSDTEKLSKHMDTLFQITHSSNFNTSIQALMLIQQITSSYQVSADRFYRTLYESLLDPRVVTSSKQALYLNLLFKALKDDLNVKRVKAFVKRIIQVLGMHGPSFVCGAFFLVRELEKQFPSLSTLVDQPEEDDSDDEEVFRDVPDEEDVANGAAAATPASSEPAKTSKTGYDSRKRDPEHSNADKSCLWELLPFLSHFHPSVSLGAESILTHKPMSGKPDLTIHTLAHFLDRFVYRNTKAPSSVARGSSAMQPLAGKETTDRLLLSGLEQPRVAVNSENFWKKKVEDVAAEDVFFHEYFSKIGKTKLAKVSKKEKKGKKSKDADDDVEDSGEENGEEEIWKALVDSRPEVEGDISEEDDLDLDDLEDEMGSEDDEDMLDDEEDGEGSGVEFHDFSDEEESAGGVQLSKPSKQDKKSTKKPADDEDEESDFDFDDSDEEAFVDSDDEIDFPLIPAAPEEDEEETEGKKSKGQERRAKKRKLKSLPTFASAEDYAAMLEDEDDGMGM